MMQFEKVKEFILKKLEKELPADLTYHSVRHIIDVYNTAGMLAQQEQISAEDLTLLLTAALFHDSGFLRDSHTHEKLSCDLAKEYLPGYGYTPDQIEKICGMIMATQIPQKPHNHLEQILCDADLDYLGRDDFFPIGDTLFAELKTYGNIRTEDEWNRLQINFLDSHHYFTTTAINLRKNKKEENLAIIKSRIKKNTTI